MIARGFSAAVYTQTTDVEIAVNGLMTYARTVIKPVSYTHLDVYKRQVEYRVSGNFAYNQNNVSKYKGELQRGWVTDENGNRVYQTNIGDVSTGGSTRVIHSQPGLSVRSTAWAASMG